MNRPESKGAEDEAYLTWTFEWMADDYLIQTRRASLGMYPGWMRRVARRVLGANPDAVLDIGAGPGYLLGLLAAEAPRVRLTGVDLSHRALEKAPAGVKTHRAEFVRFAETRQEDFDVAVATFVLRDIHDKPAFLAAAHQVLKPRGHLLLMETHTPRGLAATGFRWYFHHVLPWYARRRWIPEWPEEWGPHPYQWLSETHRQWHRGEELPEWLSAAGFERIVTLSRPHEVIMLVDAVKA